MTYSTYEESHQDGQPVELYAFTFGSTVYRYTSADADIIHQTKTYESKTIARSPIEHTAEKARNSLTITVDPSLGVIDIFRYAPPCEIVNLVVYRLHRGDTDAATIWMGRVLNVTRDSDSAKIYGEPVYTSIKRPGLRRYYQRQCPHVLYSAACGVSSITNRQTVNVAGVTGATITVTGLTGADGYFDGGYVEWEYQTGRIERRAIRQQVGSAIAMAWPMRGLAGGDIVSVYPGCDHTLATCESRFANHLNYGGMPYIPLKNPFDGTPIY